MTGVRRLWSGELPLDDAFWGWAVIGGITVNLLTSLGFLILLTMDLLLAAYFVGYGLSLPYNLVVTVGVWRAASRATDTLRKAAIYRTITVIGMALLSVT
jgi:hypothetical protein